MKILLVFLLLFISSCGPSKVVFHSDDVCVGDGELMTKEWCINHKNWLAKQKKWEEDQRNREEEERLEAEAYNDSIPIHQLCEFYDIYKYNGSLEGINLIAESLIRRGEDPLLCRKTSSSRPPIIVKEEYKFGDKYLRPFFKDRQERREREREHNEYDH